MAEEYGSFKDKGFTNLEDLDKDYANKRLTWIERRNWEEAVERAKALGIPRPSPLLYDRIG